MIGPASLQQYRDRQWGDAVAAIEAAQAAGDHARRFGGRRLRQLAAEYPALRPTLIQGLLRRGEIANIIGGSKSHKTFATTDLALCVATGRPWLGRFATTAGRVLIIDNELHGETSADRIPRIAAARGIPIEQLYDAVTVDNVRGRLLDIRAMEPYFGSIGHGEFALVVLDALYRVLPPGVSENDNAAMAGVYNQIDRYAAMLGCPFVLVHHSTKGGQSLKGVTDVGAGAGTQSRAADTHLILRPHREPGAVVLEAVTRSWPPVEPLSLRWRYPVFEPDEGLAPALLGGGGRRARGGAAPRGGAAVMRAAMSPQAFVAKFLGEQPVTRRALLDTAGEELGSMRGAERLLKAAEDQGLVRRSQEAKNRPALVAAAAASASSAPAPCARAHPPAPPRARASSTEGEAGERGASAPAASSEEMHP